MPIIDEEQFSRLLKKEITDKVFFIYGDDGFLKDHYCDKLTSLIVDDALKFFNFHTYNDDDTPLEEIFDTADTLPVMADKTCLLIRNYPLQELNKEDFAKLENCIENLPESTVMIFFYNTLEPVYNTKKGSKWNSVIGLFSKYGQAVQIDHRTPAKTAKLLVSKAKEKGSSIDNDEALYLIDCVGDDMQTLMNEFNKVCAFSQGEKITKEMIDLTAVKSVEATAFDISASIFSGDTDRAFEILNELIRIKTEPQPIIGALASAYVNMYRYKIAIMADCGYTDFAETFNYKGNISLTFGKLTAYTKKMSLSSIRKAIDILAEADVKTKTTRFDERILLTETIAKLAACR